MDRGMKHIHTCHITPNSFGQGLRNILACLTLRVLLLPGAASTAAEKAPPPPAIVELRIEPAVLTLSGPRDSRRFVVQGKTADGSWIDVTGSAAIKVNGDVVRLKEGYLEPVKN